MKRLTLTTAAIVFACTLFAQSPATLQSQSVYWINDGKLTLIDTMLHYHSNGRFSYGVPGDNAIYPDNGIYHDDSTVKLNSQKDYVPQTRYTRTFNSSGQVARLITESFLWGGPDYVEMQTTCFTYSSAGLIDLVTISLAGVDNERTSYIYNNDQLVAQLYETRNNATNIWEKWTLDSTISNGADSVYVKYIAGVGTPLKEFNRNKMQLDGSQRVIIDSCFIDKKFQTVSFLQYDAAGRRSRDSVLEWDHLLLQMKPAYNREYNYDNNGNLVSKRDYNWDAGVNGYIFSHVDSMTYYANDHLFSHGHYSYNGNDLVPAEKGVFEYFYYAFPAGVDALAKDEEIGLYPTPATTYINLQLHFNKPEIFSLHIMNMNGQALRSWSEPAQGEYKKQILLDGLPAGNYLLQVHTANGYRTKHFTIIH